MSDSYRAERIAKKVCSIAFGVAFAGLGVLFVAGITTSETWMACGGMVATGGIGAALAASVIGGELEGQKERQ